MYRREMIYMGLYQNGVRLGSAGFLKAESRENGSRLCLKVQNVPAGIAGRFPVRLHDDRGWRELSGITVRDGGGVWEEEPENVDGQIIVTVALPDEYRLEGRSRDAAAPGEYRPEGKSRDMVVSGEYRSDAAVSESEEPVQSQQENVVSREITADHTAPDEIAPDRTEPDHEAADEMVSNHIKPDYAASDRFITEPEATEDEITESVTPGRAPDEAVLVKEELTGLSSGSIDILPKSGRDSQPKEDKWEQILDMYEKIHPYGDERVCIKIEPKDFVILQGKYQHLVNNSFLLHGFYNYRYVILGKEEDYYLGVPGVFYEREKMVAQMFGFEAFECPSGTVRAGEFGYYLRKVEL